MLQFFSRQIKPACNFNTTNYFSKTSTLNFEKKQQLFLHNNENTTLLNVIMVIFKLSSYDNDEFQ